MYIIIYISIFIFIDVLVLSFCGWFYNGHLLNYLISPRLKGFVPPAQEHFPQTLGWTAPLPNNFPPKIRGWDWNIIEFCSWFTLIYGQKTYLFCPFPSQPCRLRGLMFLDVQHLWGLWFLSRGAEVAFICQSAHLLVVNQNLRGFPDLIFMDV